VTRLATILSFLLLGTFLLNCSEEPTTVTPPITTQNTILWITNPKGNETFIPFEPIQIEWDYDTSRINMAFVVLDYTLDGEAIWERIATPYASPRKYNWRLPEVSSTQFQIRIIASGYPEISYVTDKMIITSAGTLVGTLKGDGRLVPNKPYSGIEVELYQNSILLQTETTDTTGYFLFTGFDAETYEVKATVDFGYENIAYGSEVVTVGNSLVEKDVILDSIKYDFSPFHLGGTYTYLLKALWDGSSIDSMKSMMEITITNSQQIDDRILYYFVGEHRLEYSLFDDICQWEDSIYVIGGYFEDFNSQITCYITEGNDCFFNDVFKAVHIYDGSEETNNFLSLFSWLSSDPQTIEFGVPFEINNQQFETFFLHFYYVGMGRTTYQFSDSLGIVYRSDVGFMGNLLSVYTLTLIDFDF